MPKGDNAGRPPLFKTPEDIQQKIEEYMAGGYRTKEVVVRDKQGNIIDKTMMPMVTITDLCLYLGFADRHSFYEYEKKPLFTHTIKRARTFIEREYEEQLRFGNPTGAIFALKNFGWVDKVVTENTHDVTNKSELTDEQRLLIAKQTISKLSTGQEGG